MSCIDVALFLTSFLSWYIFSKMLQAEPLKFFSDFLWVPWLGNSDGAVSLQSLGTLSHEANMQFHLPNLRCKNRNLGRDAHKQKDRLLHKGGFYVEDPWSIKLLFLQRYYSGHEATVYVEELDLKRSLELCGLNLLREDWDLCKIECLTGIGSRC